MSQQSIRRELEQIAGRPNYVTDLNNVGVAVRVYVWKVTTKGVRKGDWHRLLVLADKARDLGADVYYLSGRLVGYRWYNRLEPADQSDANAVAVWIKD